MKLYFIIGIISAAICNAFAIHNNITGACGRVIGRNTTWFENIIWSLLVIAVWPIWIIANVGLILYSVYKFNKESE